MGYGILKLLRRASLKWNLAEFCLRKNIFGFDNANAFFRRLDKNAMIPILKANGAIIGKNCDIESPLIFHNCNDFSNLIIGNNCHIGKNCFFDLRGRIYIEDNAVISMQTTIITHMDLGTSSLSLIYPPTFKNVILKKNCYLGANSTILMGVTIGERCFVSAGSIVNKNVESDILVGGIPAKELKKLN